MVPCKYGCGCRVEASIGSCEMCCPAARAEREARHAATQYMAVAMEMGAASAALSPKPAPEPSPEPAPTPEPIPLLDDLTTDTAPRPPSFPKKRKN